MLETQRAWMEATCPEELSESIAEIVWTQKTNQKTNKHAFVKLC